MRFSKQHIKYKRVSLSLSVSRATVDILFKFRKQILCQNFKFIPLQQFVQRLSCVFSFFLRLVLAKNYVFHAYKICRYNRFRSKLK